METLITTKGTKQEMEELFKKSNFLSIRFFNRITNLNGLNNYEILIRHPETLKRRVYAANSIYELILINREGK